MSPRSRIIKKTEVVTNHVKCKDLLRATTLGRSKAISTSKMRKITLIKKNRRENGSRASEFGSNPHSKGEAFSRLNLTFFAKTSERTSTIVEIKKSTKMKEVK